MSALNSKQWTAGHIGTTSFESKPVTVEPVYFVEKINSVTLSINDHSVDFAASDEFMAMCKLGFSDCETIHGSGVYRLTTNNIAGIKRAMAALQAARDPQIDERSKMWK